MNNPVNIVVVGGGTAGIAAAVTAARTGCRTVLLDQRPAAGGTGGFSGLTTLCGLFDGKGDFINEGFAREFAGAVGEGAPVRMGKVWVLMYRPERFRAEAARLLSKEPNLQTCWNTPLADIKLEGSRVTRVNGLPVGAVIDCSGTAEVARAVQAECLAADEITQAPAVLFPLHDVTCKLDSPVAAAQVLLPLARAGFPPLNFQPGFDPGVVTVKFTGRPDQVPALIDFLRDNIPGFKKCRTLVREFLPAARAGRMIVGQYTLTGADVLEGRRFSDGAARCSWPIEQWGGDGVARFRYLPENLHYEIPARSLRAARIENLFMAGKTISADIDAIASARVMGCCLATGEAAGHLAARYVQSSTTK